MATVLCSAALIRYEIQKRFWKCEILKQNNKQRDNKIEALPSTENFWGLLEDINNKVCVADLP